MNQAKMWYAFISATVFVLLVCVWVERRIPDNLDDALDRFYGLSLAEDQLKDPLIRYGSRGVPDLIRIIKDPEARQRRYIISAVGNIGDRRALPVLKGLVQSNEEVGFIRSSAILAIALIDRDSAIETIESIKNNDPQIAQELYLDEQTTEEFVDLAPRRTYLEALIGRHY